MAKLKIDYISGNKMIVGSQNATEGANATNDQANKNSAMSQNALRDDLEQTIENTRLWMSTGLTPTTLPTKRYDYYNNYPGYLNTTPAAGAGPNALYTTNNSNYSATWQNSSVVTSPSFDTLTGWSTTNVSTGVLTSGTTFNNGTTTTFFVKGANGAQIRVQTSASGAGSGTARNTLSQSVNASNITILNLAFRYSTSLSTNGGASGSSTVRIQLGTDDILNFTQTNNGNGSESNYTIVQWANSQTGTQTLAMTASTSYTGAGGGGYSASADLYVDNFGEQNRFETGNNSNYIYTNSLTTTAANIASVYATVQADTTNGSITYDFSADGGNTFTTALQLNSIYPVTSTSSNIPRFKFYLTPNNNSATPTLKGWAGSIWTV